MASCSNYEQIQRLMVASRAVAEPAEAHGTLAGALCATGAYRFDDWLAEILPEGAAPGAAAMPTLRELYDATRAALHGSDMQFELLMPGDEAPIEQRTEALTLWCNGFVYGLGTSGAADPERLPGDAGEIVRDLAQIMRAGVDERAGLEANEAALAELVEFVRVGVQVVFEELGPARAPAPPPPGVSVH
ncbi:MAG: UPF0149 family protein [Gammaproteobacteria bacterium]|nr:UPF0149 family protein [Gammaproteobacteria bacterium]MDE2250477.1 UPF0149 family protein [Gammaproteobacteria bacterium]